MASNNESSGGLGGRGGGSMLARTYRPGKREQPIVGEDGPSVKKQKVIISVTINVGSSLGSFCYSDCDIEVACVIWDFANGNS